MYVHKQREEEKSISAMNSAWARNLIDSSLPTDSLQQKGPSDQMTSPFWMRCSGKAVYEVAKHMKLFYLNQECIQDLYICAGKNNKTIKKKKRPPLKDYDPWFPSVLFNWCESHTA